jgi:hypothetical protein
MATPDGRTSRLRQGLVVAQITVSALLIVTCGLSHLDICSNS